MFFWVCKYISWEILSNYLSGGIKSLLFLFYSSAKPFYHKASRVFSSKRDNKTGRHRSSSEKSECPQNVTITYIPKKQKSAPTEADALKNANSNCRQTKPTSRINTICKSAEQAFLPDFIWLAKIGIGIRPPTKIGRLSLKVIWFCLAYLLYHIFAICKYVEWILFNYLPVGRKKPPLCKGSLFYVHLWLVIFPDNYWLN